ncbi:16S rRNA (cytidine(1402)-2'-O)-methyltransferase [Alphaproteobacteria bacterium endosymbiont of Tiliacea citrago]|uniref:16S rRNA (cytidine(1402)-2'-O)-methyltransferase n=1 Tax=Alphaproteobacteria bacterium endosymbiont of Tiliacea citrago TaxID=3077944 RepID=UPI00313E1C0C
MKSIAYIVGVPIGNYKDITLRALQVLKEVSLILCEDTRETQKLLDEFLIKKDLISYVGSKDLSFKRGYEELKKKNSIAIVSDRGMPCISDPGSDLICYFRSANFEIKVIPGVSSVTSSFSLTGLKGNFNFIGFLPRKATAIKQEIENNLRIKSHLIFFESSHRIQKTMQILSDFIEKKIFILKEITKTYEEFFFDTPEALSKIDIKGELVVIIPN